MIENGAVMKVVHAQGQFLDGGDVDGWLYANQVVLGKAWNIRSYLLQSTFES